MKSSFFETISHHIAPYKPAAVSSSFNVESRLATQKVLLAEESENVLFG
jgi:hypothetical protein